MSGVMSQGFSGGCLCGAVRYQSSIDPQFVGHCHCVDCRKSSGTGHCTHVVIPEDAFTVSGEVKFYDRAADSGNVVSRGFCPNCGSPIYSKNSGMPDVVFPRASSLDDPEIVKPQMVVYAQSRALMGLRGRCASRISNDARRWPAQDGSGQRFSVALVIKPLMDAQI